jgi:hypothetical protein
MGYSIGHDIHYPVLTTALTVTSASGISTATFGVQTRAVQITAFGNTSSNAAVFVKFGNVSEAPQASSTADIPVPLNFPVIFKCYPGQRASLISGDATASYRAYVSELSD